MKMKPVLRKFMLSIHITSSVGWIGAVIAYLALVLAAMRSPDAKLLIAVWTTLYLIGYYAIVPMSLAALLTGIIQSLGTQWGLFRHYWVLISLGLTIFAAVVLLEHMQTVSSFAGMAATGDAAHNGMLTEALKGEFFHAGIGLLVLLVAQVLNIYKPRGLSPYGWRKQQEERKLLAA